ncbi:MAG: hypothetical protein ACOX6N_03380 [Patescibacteria group bacterium]|jgi:ribosomal protein S27AE
MTKIKQYEITCVNCGHKFSASAMLSTNSFMPQPTEEQKQKAEEFWENNGVCPKCGYKNEIKL